MKDIEVVSQPLKQLTAKLADDLRSVDLLIRERMVSQNVPRIPEVTQYLLDAGGKKLRPILTLASANMFDYVGHYHIYLAATVEFIHTATLLHDDVVDGSLQRRGRPTPNLLWDNKSSVLVGDFLFARSFQLMTETNNLRVLELLADTSATIAEGEVLQLTAAQSLTLTEEIYLQIVRGKTAALFSAAAEVGGVIANASELHLEALRNYGDALGIAFQIADDLLDYTDDNPAFGKNIGDDFRDRKMTLPVIKAVAHATENEKAFWVRTIVNGQQQEGDLDEVLRLLKKYDAIEKTRADAQHWSYKACASIECLPECQLRNLLCGLAKYIIDRLS
ncbi:MAG: polyprenyl synthetase family protein [Aestuariivita sp.]|nr:polyprenyl synthetase family protein [Aestuariivita sp.]